MPGSAGMVTPSVLLAQSFMSIAFFGRAIYIEASLAVLTDKRLFGSGLHFGACCAFQIVTQKGGFDSWWRQK